MIQLYKLEARHTYYSYYTELAYQVHALQSIPSDTNSSQAEETNQWPTHPSGLSQIMCASIKCTTQPTEIQNIGVLNAYVTRKKLVYPLLFLSLRRSSTELWNPSFKRHPWGDISCPAGFTCQAAMWGWSNLRNWWQYLIIRLRWLKRALTYNAPVTRLCCTISLVS